VQRPEVALVPRMALHRLGRANGERPDGGVIQIDEIARDGEELAQRCFVHRAVCTMSGLRVAECGMREEPQPATRNPTMHRGQLLAVVSALWGALIDRGIYGFFAKDLRALSPLVGEREPRSGG